VRGIDLTPTKPYNSTMNKSTVIGAEGEIRRAKDIGLSGAHRMIYLPCKECGKLRWMPVGRVNDYCPPCVAKHCHGKRPWQSERQRGAKNRWWKGGRVGVGQKGRYIGVLVYPNDPYYPMALSNGYILEHRLVMARALGRLLHKKEQVHHKNGDRQDNRLENLELWTLAQPSHPSGVRASDHHCPGCRCFEHKENDNDRQTDSNDG